MRGVIEVRVAAERQLGAEDEWEKMRLFLEGTAAPPPHIPRLNFVQAQGGPLLPLMLASPPAAAQPQPLPL